jgi:hypothetical protein
MMVMIIGMDYDIIEDIDVGFARFVANTVASDNLFRLLKPSHQTLS